MHYLEKELNEKIRDDQSIFVFLQDAALDGIWYWDLENPDHEWFSSKFWETLGYDPSTKNMLASEWQSIINPDDLKRVYKSLEKHLNDSQVPFDEVTRYQHKKGHTVWIRCRGIAIRNDEGKPIRMLGAHTDVTEHKKVENHLRSVKEEYETVFNGTQDALFLIDVIDDMHFRFLRNNPAHQKQTGLSKGMIEGKTPQDLLGDTAGEVVAKNYQRCVYAKTSINYEETLHLPAGERIWQTTLTPVMADGVVKHIVGSGVDITSRKALEKELERRANYDALTNLANRDYLTRALMKRIRANTPFTLVFIDIDNFKAINDTHGHTVGDQVLETVAARLQTVREADDLPARFGGDEFIMLKNYSSKGKGSKSLIDTLDKTCSKPMRLNNHHIDSITISIGMAHFPEDGSTYDELMYKADQAMYAMKRQRNNNH